MERCADCDVGLLDFVKNFNGKTRELFHLCVRHKLILDSKECEVCGKQCTLDFNKKLWRCQKVSAIGKKKKKKCTWQQSVFKNTFFEHSSLDLETVLTFVNVYLRECFTYRFMRYNLHITDKTTCDWASFCREVLVEWCLKREGAIGGEGKIVEIDESKFGKRKHNVGRLVEGQWVFGGVCRQTRQCFMVPVNQRDSQTLLNVIKEKILPGTTIISDCWRAYNCLKEEGYQHLQVNHSIHFVDPHNPNVHTNTIERLWGEAKRKVPLFGRRRKHFAGYLARSLFLMAIPDDNKRFHIFLQEAASLYNPYQPNAPEHDTSAPSSSS